jgi:hypothetical protein
MPSTSHAAFDFRRQVAYDPASKGIFHRRARSQLRRLAVALGLKPGSYDLRSNYDGIAVSGEANLHTDRLYIQVCQPATGHNNGILCRTCNGQKDYVGGPNNFASLDLLNDPNELSRRIREACHV